MGPMVRGRPLDRKRLTRWSAAAIVALFIWSFIAAPSAQTEETEIVEPETLSAYNATADAAPVVSLLDHQIVLVQLPPTIAHTNAEVALPSQANSIAYLLDNGIANGLHGTTTGNKVPTEVTAAQPGGAEKDEFVLAEQQLGNDATGRVGAGVARATAEHSIKPRGYAHAYLGNLVLLPAPGSPDDPPGTYDPQNDADRETEHLDTLPVPEGSPTPGDDPRAYTPNPSGQMAILSVGSVASTSETYREDDKVISIAVAEINGINLGNRTGDNRCTNCVTIDSIRIEARAESNGTPAGASAAWRLLIHRACRVAAANDANGNAYEGVRCLDPNPDKIIEVVSEEDHRNPASFEDAFLDTNANGVRRVESVDALNEMFEKGLGSGDMSTGDLGIRMFFGKHGSSKVTDAGEVASAIANGLEFQVTTAAPVKALGMFASSAKPVLAPIDEQCGAAPPVGPAAVPCPGGLVDKASTLRTVSFTLGHVAVSAVARPGAGTVGAGGGGTGGTGTPPFPSFDIPKVNIPSFNIPAGGGGNTYVVGGGIGPGALKLKIDWASVRLKPWKPMDMAKGFFATGLAVALGLLIRRRLRAMMS